jgi:diketogulonate reductase-like aldo/keto reductase
MAPAEMHSEFGKVQKDKSGLLHTTLYNGRSFPLVGFGTFPGDADKEQVTTAVVAAVKAGYRHIDTAEFYGLENEVGAGLQQLFKEGVVAREDLHVTTKLWNNHHKKEDVEPTLRASLKRLQLDYVDLYLVHWPAVEDMHKTPMTPPLEETWKAMEQLADKGLAKSIGVSNWSIKKTMDLLQYARIRPAVNQVEVHPYFRNTALLEYSKRKGIHLSAYSPLGGQVPNKPDLVHHPVVMKLSEQLKMSPGQILLRWGIQHGVSVLPKSVHEERIKENLDLSDWEIPEAEFNALSNLEVQQRAGGGLDNKTAYWWELITDNGPYRKPADLWDD